MTSSNYSHFVATGVNEEGGYRVQGHREGSMHLRPLEGAEKEPLVTIITVVFNGINGLEKTIKSVLSQSYKPIEYIVIDGGSTDGSIEIIKKYEHRIAYWKSEKDSGIYDAMSKGIALATGDYIGIIGAGDWYEDGAIAYIVSTAVKTDADVIYGNVVIVDVETNFSYVRESSIELIPRSMSSISHPSTFVKTSIYLSQKFNPQLRIAADYYLFLGLYLSGYRFVNSGAVIVNITTGGVSGSFETQKEVFKVHRRYYGFLYAMLHYMRSAFRYHFYFVRRRVLTLLLPPKWFAFIRGRWLKYNHR
jgi:glycosyltransferase involved in cell wall biosynthesis